MIGETPETSVVRGGHDEVDLCVCIDCQQRWDDESDLHPCHSCCAPLCWSCALEHDVFCRACAKAEADEAS